MRILLLDTGSKLPSLALMKLSTFHKNQGHQVTLMNFGDKRIKSASFDLIFVSVIFTRDRHRVELFQQAYGEKVVAGGPGWSLQSKLPEEVEQCNPDFSLYTADILYPRLNGPYTRETRQAKARDVAAAGLGRTTSGCVRRCSHCLVPKAEGELRQADRLEDLVSPHSNVVNLLDNNLSADPFGVDKLKQAQRMRLVLNVTQGIDLRASSDEFLETLCQTSLWSDTIYFAWDRMRDERAVLEGIRQIKPLTAHYKKDLTCFCLAGFDTTHEEDLYRIETLKRLGIRPYLMPINQADRGNPRLLHLKRWVNMFFYRRMTFDDYEPWRRFLNDGQQGLFDPDPLHA